MLLPRFSMIMMIFLSALIALSSYRFLILGLPLAFPGMPGHIENRQLAFLLHISLAPVALLLGSLQLLPNLRSKQPAYHRWAGRLYGIAVLIAGIAGMIVAVGAEGGIIASSGFGLLAILWLYVTAKGINHARAREFKKHRQWMLRSFALTFAGVTLRLELLGFMFAGFEYTEASIYLAWTAWLPNLLFIEWWLRRHPQAP